jgi:hypothetical protein
MLGLIWNLAAQQRPNAALGPMIIVARAVVALLLSSFWVSTAMAVDFDTLFVEELSSRGVSFEESGDGMYKVHANGRELTVNTQNIRAEVLRDNEPEAIGGFC